MLRTATAGVPKQVRTKPLMTLSTITKGTALFRLRERWPIAVATLLRKSWMLPGLITIMCGVVVVLLQMVTWVGA